MFGEMKQCTVEGPRLFMSVLHIYYILHKGQRVGGFEVKLLSEEGAEGASLVVGTRG